MDRTTTTPAVSLIDPTQQALNSAIQGAAMRQQLLTANLANVNTPGYQRQDVDFHAQLRDAMAAGETSATYAPAVERGAQSADGNGIDLERESAELAKNALDQQALVTVARSRIDILTTAIGSGA